MRETNVVTLSRAARHFERRSPESPRTQPRLCTFKIRHDLMLEGSHSGGFMSIKHLLLISLAAITLPSGAFAEGAHEGAHWTYKEVAKWGTLSKEFAECSVGKEQSPIDIKATVKADLQPIKFDYKLSGLNIVDNGHTIQVNYDPGSSISIAGSTYQLVQFHFHHPSEEKINGKGQDMVIHLVHQNAERKLAVVAVLVRAGDQNPVLQTLWTNIPGEKEKAKTAKDITVDASQFLPSDRNYYTFTGSLTTPPCSEGVNWFVLKTPITASSSQLATFAKIYPNNARPVQALYGRVVRTSN
jgi:carbonic anhydrase